MSKASGTRDPTVPIGSAIIETLKRHGAQSASTLARHLQLRKADVLVSCRALAAATQIRRLGKRWALRQPVRCAALNKAGQPCARFAAHGSAFCAQHEPDVEVPRLQRQALSPHASIVETLPQKNVMTAVASPAVQHDDVRTEPETPDDTPEFFVRGHRVTRAMNKWRPTATVVFRKCRRTASRAIGCAPSPA